jgi:hypothetical protein
MTDINIKHEDLGTHELFKVNEKVWHRYYNAGDILWVLQFGGMNYTYDKSINVWYELGWKIFRIPEIEEVYQKYLEEERIKHNKYIENRFPELYPIIKARKIL